MQTIDETTQQDTPVPPSPPPCLPLRFWIAVDNGLMTLDAAKAEWARLQAAGEMFDPLG